jgi:sulfatase modifying factor 1
MKWLLLLALTAGATLARAENRRLPVPAGVFTMGASPEQQRHALSLCQQEVTESQVAACRAEIFLMEGPERRVYLPAYAIDQNEVSIGEYRACVRAAACTATPLSQPDPRFDKSELPATWITHAEAASYCAYKGGFLPSEAQWERAARGTDARLYPWGNDVSPKKLNHGRFSGEEVSSVAGILLRPDDSDGFVLVAPTDAFADSASPIGARNMAGNVIEWTSDHYGETPPQQSSVVRPVGPKEGPLFTTRGGSFRQPLLYQRTTWRDGLPADTRSVEIGFRCAYGP